LAPWVEVERMKSFVAAVIFLLATPAAARAETTLVARDVPLHGGRSLESATPTFDLVGLHWQGSGTVAFRTRSVAGRWSAWHPAAPEAEDAPDRTTLPTWHLGNPYWTGASDGIAYRLRGRVKRLRAYFVRSPAVGVPARRLSIANSPPLITRAGWGANESIRRAAPRYADSVKFALVHHTAGTNSYSRMQSAAIVRGIEIYHVKGNGWNDIGYNFLVDRYGQIFEGRYGGLDRPVIGAHALGFNRGSVGVAVIGSFSSVAPPAAARAALEKLLAWRLDVAHVDPLSTLTWQSGGNPRFPAGVPVFLRAIAGHRDTGFTDCPGNVLYAQLPTIAHEVAAIGLPKIYGPVVEGDVEGAVRFGARLSASLPWTVTVTDPTGATVASGSGTGTTVDFTWDASTAKPQRYTWTIAAPGARSATGTIGATLGPLTLRGLAATPSTVTAGANGTTIAYTLSIPATVTATLVDPAGTTVATLFSGLRRAGKQTFTFTADQNTAEGHYAIVLFAQSADGQTATGSIPVSIDRTLSVFAAEKAAFSPNGDGVQDTLELTFAIAVRPAAVRLEIVRGATLVATPLAAQLQPGPQTATWDGRSSAGARVADGRYQARMTVTDDIGTFQRGVPVVVDTRAPRLRVVSWRRLRFAVDERSAVRLTVDGRTTTRNVAAGPFSFPVRGVPRRVAIVATDAAGNSRRLRYP
jgi:methionine-rich copper-binding protein CopC